MGTEMTSSSRSDTEFRSVTVDDLNRDAKVTAYVQQHLADWQAKGWVPDMRIEPGAPLGMRVAALLQIVVGHIGIIFLIRGSC